MATDDQGCHGWLHETEKVNEYVRGPTAFQDWVSSEEGAKFPPVPGRYHLYVSYTCPWAHRTLIMRKLKGLEDVISVTCLHWNMTEKGWRFARSGEDIEPSDVCTPDPYHPDFKYLADLYTITMPSYNGRFSVPLLYDKETKAIVNNQSSDIMRMMNSAFNQFIPDKDKRDLDLYPEDLRKAIDLENNLIHDLVNKGVYKCGLATSQEEHERAALLLFTMLDVIEARFAGRKGTKNSNDMFYHGERMTETDVHLFTTIVRFDVVYAQHYKTNIRDIRSGYPYIHTWLRLLYWALPHAFQETTWFDHIKKGYTQSQTQVNPTAVTPLGPVPDILPLGQEVRALEVKSR